MLKAAFIGGVNLLWCYARTLICAETTSASNNLTTPEIDQV